MLNKIGKNKHLSSKNNDGRYTSEINNRNSFADCNRSKSNIKTVNCDMLDMSQVRMHHSQAENMINLFEKNQSKARLDSWRNHIAQNSK